MFGLGKKDKTKIAAQRYPRLLRVLGGEQFADYAELDVEIDYGPEHGGVEQHAYTYRASDPHGVAPQIGEWLRKHPALKLTKGAAVVYPADVKLEAARRIRNIAPRWKIERAMTGGKPISAADQKRLQAVRDASDLLERQSPIPLDYADDKYWP